jgi:hypothetical protein
MFWNSKIWFGCLAVVLLAAGPVFGQRDAPVPPTLEIEVLDPNADALGNPAIDVLPSADGGMVVEIPPVVLVHRYYYTGNRSFQGPMLPGGPSIVVCHHPKNGERCYIPVQMLPGAPMVHYTSCGIEYDYGRHGIKVVFPLLCKPKVTYRNCTPVTRVAKRTCTKVCEGAACVVEATRLPEAAAAAGRVSVNLGCSAHSLTEEAVGVVVNPVTQIVNATPIGSVICKEPEDIPQRIRDLQAQRASRQQRRENAWIPTLR